MDRPTYMLGFLLMVAGGFLLIYGAMESYTYSEFESSGLNLFFAGLIIGVIGVIVPKEMIRSAWIAMGLALFSTVVLYVSVAIVAFARGWDIAFVPLGFWMFFLLITIVAFFIIVLIKRR